MDFKVINEAVKEREQIDRLLLFLRKHNVVCTEYASFMSIQYDRGKKEISIDVSSLGELAVFCKAFAFERNINFKV